MPLTFVDLFCGMGGFHLAISQSCNNFKCVFASDIDKFACATYKANFGITPKGDITKIKTEDIPAHELLCGGFPCQSFSSIGKREGFEHSTKGTLFFEICRILKHHRPSVCFLENVTGLLTHDKGKTFTVVRESLNDIGYHVTTHVFDGADFGLPAHRKRVFIVGFLQKEHADAFKWPVPPCVPVGIGTIVEDHENGYCITEHLQNSYLFKHKDGRPRTDGRPRVVDKSTSTPANTLVSTYHKIQRLTGTFVKDGKTGLRLFSENECKQIMGFPIDFKIPVSRTQMYRQTGNSVSVPVVKAIMDSINSAVVVPGCKRKRLFY